MKARVHPDPDEITAVKQNTRGCGHIIHSGKHNVSDAEAQMKRPLIKAILSVILVLIFGLLVFTGALLYFGKTGIVWGISRHILREVHFWVAISMCILIPIHFVLNFRILRAEFRMISKDRQKATNDHKMVKEDHETKND